MIPQLGDHENGEDEDAEDGYGQKLDADRECWKAALRLGLSEC
jgi:hypothetical protein